MLLVRVKESEQTKAALAEILSGVNVFSDALGEIQRHVACTYSNHTFSDQSFLATAANEEDSIRTWFCSSPFPRHKAIQDDFQEQ
jgi:hypothetical protein